MTEAYLKAVAKIIPDINSSRKHILQVHAVISGKKNCDLLDITSIPCGCVEHSRT